MAARLKPFASLQLWVGEAIPETRRLCAEIISATFKTFARRYGLDGKFSPFDFSKFRPPRIEGEQLRLF
jgi:hypothetical protein